jgi:hypothetical protein
MCGNTLARVAGDPQFPRVKLSGALLPEGIFI